MLPVLSRTIPLLQFLLKPCGLILVWRCRLRYLMTMLTRLALDYMNARRIFTVDPQYFPLNRMREIVDYLHSHDQKYGMPSLQHGF